jgi:uncharacterized protein
LQRWARELLRTREARELPAVVAGQLAAQFLVPQVAIRVWDVLPEFAQDAFAQGASEDVTAFASSLTRPYCGVHRGLEVARWLEDPASVASLALIPLRAGLAPQAFGLLVLGSPDPQRFTADMGTDFLERIGELASAALARLRPLVPPEQV